MGTHPIFESDFDCLTECDRFYRVPSLCFEIRFVAVVSGTRRPPNRCEELKTTGFTCTSFPSAVGSLLSLTPRTRLSSLESQKNWDGMPNMPDGKQSCVSEKQPPPANPQSTPTTFPMSSSNPWFLQLVTGRRSGSADSPPLCPEDLPNGAGK